MWYSKLIDGVKVGKFTQQFVDDNPDYEWVEFEDQTYIPDRVENLQIRLALIDFGIMPSSITAMIYEIEDQIQREKLITLWEYSNVIERMHPDVIHFVNLLSLTEAQKNQLFLLASTK